MSEESNPSQPSETPSPESIEPTATLPRVPALRDRQEGGSSTSEQVEPALLEITSALAAVQEQIREATQRRVDLLAEGDEDQLEAFDAELAALRAERQRLLDEQLRLNRQALSEGKEQDNQGTATAGNAPGISRRREVARASAKPPLAVRVAATFLVFAGVGLLVAAGLFLLADRFLIPDPIVLNEDGQLVADGDFLPTGDMTPEERLLALYLSTRRDDILRTPSDDPSPVSFKIESGETAITIAERLEEEGLILDSELFRRLLQFRRADQSLEAGDFQLARNMTMDEIIASLQVGELEEVLFTLPEGWRAEQMAERLATEGLVSADEYMALVRDPSRFDYDFLRELPPGSTLEGYLFPDTYSVFKEEASAETIIRMQLDNFDRRVTPELRAAATARGMSLHQAVILASIVEREAVVAEERATIAGVYINRWNDGTVLNADPTIQYAIGFREDAGGWWSPLRSEDLQLDSPYNTYTQRGLPPSPISSPGIDSISSTIQAPNTDYYYFVSRNDGTHVFAVTLEEHNANVAQFQSGE